MYYLSVDSGARYTKLILFRNIDVLGRKKFLTSYSSSDIEKHVNELLARHGLTFVQINQVIATGSYPEFIGYPNLHFSDSKAVARALNQINPQVRTIIDIGFESSRVIKINESGHIIESLLNERCATGAGSFAESLAISLNMTLEEFSSALPAEDKKISISSQCVVFAESEAISLIHSGVDRRDIAAAVNESLANKTATLVRRAGLEEKLAIVGGMAYNFGFVASVKNILHLDDIFIPAFPEFVPAYGAFLLYMDGDR